MKFKSNLNILLSLTVLILFLTTTPMNAEQIEQDPMHILQTPDTCTNKGVCPIANPPESKPVFRADKDFIDDETKVLSAAMNRNEKLVYAILDKYEGDNQGWLALIAYKAFKEINHKHDVLFENYLKTAWISKNPVLIERASQILPQSKIGKPFEEFPSGLKTIDGKPLTMTRFKGKVLLIKFWASWCGPCKREFPQLIEIYNKLSSPNFEVLSVSIDKDANKYFSYMKKNPMPWINYLDSTQEDVSLARIHDISAIPLSYLIDKKGIIRATNLRGEELHKTIESLIQE